MSLFDGVIGHKESCAYLERVFEQGQLAHAYVFSGPAHLGKSFIADRMASAFQNVLIIEREVDEKTGARKQTIPVERIREIRSHLQLTSFDGGKKVVIVRDADTMTIAAQNALLKTLEEPKGDTLLVLIATHADLLLETIRSRTVHVAFQPVAREEICAYLAAKTEKEQAHTIAGFAAGRPGVAVALLGPDLFEAWQSTREQAITFLHGTLALRMKTIEALIKEKDPAKISQTIQAWRQVAHDCLLFSSNNESLASSSDDIRDLAKKKPANDWASSLRVLSSIEDSLSKNVNAMLALEQFAIHR